MAAANVMFCVDIFESILEQLSPGPLPTGGELFPVEVERKTHQRSLASMARVCKAVSDTALDVLWSVVDDIMHVLRILVPNNERLNVHVSVYRRSRACLVLILNRF